jgi:hypothetical protein
MPALTPRASWLRERAEKCRARATSDIRKKRLLLRMAAAYEEFADTVRESAEHGERLLKQQLSKTTQPASRRICQERGLRLLGALKRPWE